MNAVFCALLLAGTIYAAASGQADAAQRALLSGGAQAVELCLSLAGAYAFFGGVMGLLAAGGLSDALAAALRRPVSRLLRFAPGEEKALCDVCMNLSADMLGMGNAATPAGLRAMRTMAKANPPGEASGAMLMFLVLNTTSVQLLPTTMIALRAQAGAKNPSDIVIPTLISTAAATACGLIICRLCAPAERKRAARREIAGEKTGGMTGERRAE